MSVVENHMTSSTKDRPTAPPRAVSVDAFRGFVIGGMLLVNNVIWTETTPRQLMHAKWNQGVTFTDLIFPWFLLAMGVAIALSGVARKRRRVGRGSSWWSSEWCSTPSSPGDR